MRRALKQPNALMIRMIDCACLLLAFCVAVTVGTTSLHAADYGPGFTSQPVLVDGATVSLTTGGTGPAVLLLHGYAETSRMWKPLAKTLAPHFTVIAADLPGIGDSSIPKTGLDMKTSAERIHTPCAPSATPRCA